jgi:hypothetical protein
LLSTNPKTINAVSDTLSDLRKRGDSNPRTLAGRSLSRGAVDRSQGSAHVLTCENSDASNPGSGPERTRTETQTETLVRVSPMQVWHSLTWERSIVPQPRSLSPLRDVPGRLAPLTDPVTSAIDGWHVRRREPQEKRAFTI